MASRGGRARRMRDGLGERRGRRHRAPSPSDRRGAGGQDPNREKRRRDGLAAPGRRSGAATLDGQGPVARRARGPPRGGDDARREDRAAPYALRHAHARPADAGGRAEFRRLRAGHTPARRAAPSGERCRPRRRQPCQPTLRRHAPAVEPGDRRDLRSGPGAQGRRDDRRRGPRHGFFRAARRWRRSDPRPARRALVRIRVRGPAADRRDRRRRDRRRAEPQAGLDDEALRRERAARTGG